MPAALLDLALHPWQQPPDDLPALRCAGQTALFFDADRVDEAKAICTGNGSEPCPSRAACLALALLHDEHFGVWGGYTPAERRGIVAAIRRQADEKRQRTATRTNGRFASRP